MSEATHKGMSQRIVFLTRSWKENRVSRSRWLRGSFGEASASKQTQARSRLSISFVHFLNPKIPNYRARLLTFLAKFHSATKLIRPAGIVRRASENVLDTTPCLSRTVPHIFNRHRVPHPLQHRPTLPYLRLRRTKACHRPTAHLRAPHLLNLPRSRPPSALLRTTQVPPSTRHWQQARCPTAMTVALAQARESLQRLARCQVSSIRLTSPCEVNDDVSRQTNTYRRPLQRRQHRTSTSTASKIWTSP